MQMIHAEDQSAFQKFQAFLASKTSSALDAGNTVSERITVERKNGNIIFHQTVCSESPEGTVEVPMKWSLTIPLFLAAKVEKHEFFDKTVQISFVSEDGAQIFPYEGTTIMRTKDGHSTSETKSGKADKFGISFKSQKEADDFMSLYKNLIEELKK
jgi:hypothetical protein